MEAGQTNAEGKKTVDSIEHNSPFVDNGNEKNKKYNQYSLRIAFISCEYPPAKGGIGTYVKQIAKGMAGLGWDVHVFAGGKKDFASEHTELYHLHRVECETGNDFRHKVVAAFSSQHSLLPFDLIESPEIDGNAWEIKKAYPEIPLIVRLHASSYIVEKFKRRYISFLAKLRFVAGSIRQFKFDLGYWRPYDKLSDPDYQFTLLADYITAPSEVMKQWAVKYWKIPSNKILVIPNIFSAPAALLNIPIVEDSKYKRIVFFGRLNVLKGLVNATIAVKKILKEYPEWQFRVIGDDERGPNIKISMRNWMKLQLKEVAGQVEFRDGMAYEELPGAIEESEIILLPSLFESFSYTCIEAMAAGKAVIGSNRGGMADLLENDNSGILINPDKSGEIYHAVKKLIDNNVLRFQLSQKARQRILHEFSAEKTGTEFKRFYEKINGGKISLHNSGAVAEI